MANPTTTYGDLENLLVKYGYRLTVLPQGHHAFHHPASGSLVTLPAFPPDRPAHEVHWRKVQDTLDDYGYLPGDQFFDAVRDRRKAVS